RIYAAGDADGFRALVLGRLDESIVVSSETCAFDLIGAEMIREIRPGEVVAMECPDRLRVVHQFTSPQQAPCIFEHVYFARPDSVIFGNNVAEVRKRFGHNSRGSIRSMRMSSFPSPTPASSQRSATRRSRAS